MADTMERTCRQCEMLESEAADNCVDIDGRMVAHNWDDPRDAEIEQLRSKLADAVERYQKFSDNLTGPRDAEIERLRTVLADKERLAHRLAAECVERLEDQTRLRAELAGVKRMVKGVNMETESEIDRLQRDNVIYRACANGYAESALRALMDMTGSYNKDNPWLGVTAAVALLMPGKTR